MKRRLLSMITVLALCLALLPVTASAAEVVASGDCGTNLTWTLDDAGVLTISGTGDMTHWPYRDGAPWYAHANDITRVNIESGVTDVGSNAFYYCQNLVSVTIPDTVTSIGSSAFNGCSKLADADIPAGVTEIGKNAFHGTALTSVEVPAGVTTIYTGTFGYCRKLTSVTLHEGLTAIGERAFQSCTGLTDITLPDSVTRISDEAFADCSGLTGVTLPAGLETFSAAAFSRCSNLTSLEASPDSRHFSSTDGVLFNKDKTELVCYPIGRQGAYEVPAGTSSIAGRAFENCTGLTDVTLPNSVTSIGASAFEGCNGLTSVTLPDSVTSLGASAFQNCLELQRVNVPTGVTAIPDSLFCLCNKLSDITLHDNITSIGNRGFYNCGMTRITVPPKVTSIGSEAFQRCHKLQSATLPDSVTSLGASAFQECESLTGVDLPKNITSIAASTFYLCSSLTGITIPAGVTEIGNGAFEGCGSLKDVTFEGNMDSITIGSDNNALLTFQEPTLGSDGWYEIKNASNLFWFAQLVNGRATTDFSAKNARLTCDVDLLDGTVRRDTPWAPIGSSGNSYIGTFDGCGYSVKNLVINSEENYQGLFGCVSSGTRIQNVIMDSSCSITGGRFSAALVGKSDGHVIITGCGSNAAVTAAGDAGGILGACSFTTYNEPSIITDCYNAGPVTAAGESSYAGGIIGYISGSTTQGDAVLTNCWVSGKITGAAVKNDPFVGRAIHVTLDNCYILDTLPASQWTGATSTTAEALASGEAAWLLQAGREEMAWGQRLTDPKDAHPIPTGDGAKRVHKVTFATTTKPEYAVRYTNPAGMGDLPEDPPVDNGCAFYRWSQTDSEYGTAFTSDTEVAGDMTVHAVQYNMYGVSLNNCKIKTTYGTEGKLSLGSYIYFANGDPLWKGMFSATINSGNEDLGAWYQYDDSLTLHTPATAPAGQYTLSVTVNSSKQASASLLSLDAAGSSGTLGTESLTFDIAVTVDPKPLTITGTALADKTYDGTDAAAVTAVTFDGLVNGDTLTLGTDYTAAAAFNSPNVADANTVTGTVTLNNKNYTLGDNNAFTVPNVSMAKRDLTVTAKDQTIVSGEDIRTGLDQVTLEGLAAADELTGIVLSKTATAIGTHPGDITVGSAAITRSGADVAANYDITYVPGTLTIDKITPTVTAWPTATAITYGQTLSDSKLSGGEAGVDGSFAWKDGAVKPAVSDSETTPYAVIFTPTDTANYNTVAGTLTLTVNKSQPTVAFNGYPTTATYSGAALAAPTAEQMTVTGVAYEDVAFTWTQNGTEAQPVNAGTYTLTAAIAATPNTEGATATQDVTISPKVLGADAITLEQGSYVYTGSAFTPAVTVKDGDTVLAENTDYTVAYRDNTAAGTATVTVTDVAGGNYTVNGEKTFEIAKATPTVTAPEAKELHFTGEEQELVAAGSTTGGELQYRLGDGDYGTAIPKALHIGTYTVYYKVVGDDNYNDVEEKSLTVRIDKTAPAYQAPTAVDGLVYDGTAKALVENGSATGGTLLYAVVAKDAEPPRDDAYSAAIPTATDAGEYTVYYKVIGDADHGNIAPKTVSVTIAHTYAVAFDGETVSAASSNAGTYCVIFAAYKDGALVSLKTVDVTFAGAGMQTQNIAKPAGFDDSGADTVKAFLWTGLGDMHPLCPAAVKPLK